MENNQNTTTTQQEGTQQTDQGQQSEKLFTQADVDRIVGNRLARMKQDLETSDTYRRERDEARRELENYKNSAFLKEKGVKADDMDYVSFKASQLIDDKTDFRQAAEKFLKDINKKSLPPLNYKGLGSFPMLCDTDLILIICFPNFLYNIKLCLREEMRVCVHGNTG